MAEKETPREIVALRIQDGGRDLLVVRRTADGLAGEVVITTPGVRTTFRLPEIAPAFGVIEKAFEAQGAPKDGPMTLAHVEIAAAPWSAAQVV